MRKKMQAGTARKVALSIVVPCYNEEKSLEDIVRRVSKARPEKNGYQLVLVDNGSSDGTEARMATLCRKNRFVKSVRVKRNIGYGFGIISGLRAADGEFVGWTHADLQTDPLDAVRAYELARKHVGFAGCYVKGKRKNRPFLDSFFTLGMSAFAFICLGRWLDDINAQPNIFRRDFLARLSGAPNDFSFDLYAYYKAQETGMRVMRFPVDFSKRVHGTSHWNTGFLGKWRFIKRTAQFTLELRRKLSEERK